MPQGPLNPVAVEFIKDVRVGAFDRAVDALPLLSGPFTEPLHRAVADLQAHLHQWADAADALEAVTAPDAALHRRLYRNLASLKAHRPTVYRAIMAEIESPAGVYRPHALAGGAFAVARANDAGAATPLNANPAAQVQSADQQLAPLIEQGRPLAFLSVYDGHVLAAVAARPPALLLGRQQPLTVIEPDVGLLLANLFVHDFTGPLGPIEQPRIGWYVGPKWAEALRLDLLTDRYQVFPQTHIKQSDDAATIEVKLGHILKELGDVGAAAVADAAAYYAGLTSDEFARALRGDAGRAPRVMLLTTRFSTVLQYSTRDTADALRRLGCETLVMIEPTPHGGMTRMTMQIMLAEFKPDLVFQIDHNRFEHNDVFPDNLPFVNWIQDLLGHLMSPQTGRRIGVADFVLTPSTQRWTGPYEYPVRQCLEFRKLTRIPGRPLSWAADDRRVAYVSNWSQRPQEIRAELLAGVDAITARVLSAACDRMIDVYAAGSALSTAGDVRRLVNTVLAEQGLSAPDALVAQVSTRLFDRMNNVLYRQQGLAWAAAACTANGLKLEIFGDGWDRHPTLARYARGPVAYGDALERLTRDVAVNLVLEPFVCVTHQRLLDASVAGGFCLIRGNTPTRNLQWLIDLIADERVRPNVSADLVRSAAIDPQRRAAVDAALAEFATLDAAERGIDAVAAVVALQDSGFLPYSGPMLPHLPGVTFDTPDELGHALHRFTRDPALRARVARQQRTDIEARYGYAAGMKRMLAFVAERMEEPKHVRRAA